MKILEPATESLGRSVNLLHLEDSIQDRELVAKVLEESRLCCTTVYASTRSEFERTLSEKKTDLILSDFSLPAYDGMSALAAARKAQPQTPFIFVSGTIGEERAVASLKAGATDYVVKNHLSRLGQAVWRALREAEELQRSKKLEEQLLQARKMEAVGQLAGGIAHDFNNLLSVILGNAELGLQTTDGANGQKNECLRRIMVASGRAANLTSQLLAFSRKQVINLQPLKLNGVVENLTKMLTRLIGENIQLTCCYAEVNPVVFADLCMIELAVMNLVVNARDAMPQGGQLTISTALREIDAKEIQADVEARLGEFACVKVRDTGTGMSAAVLSHVFEPFFTTKDVGKGTGLGLATVHGIIKQHHGWIKVSSQVGRGRDTFEIFLPICQRTEELNGYEDNEAVPGGNETILLVEDEAALSTITCQLLESRGYKVIEAASAPQALKCWEAHSDNITLLVTDIVMPGGINGWELADQLRGEKSGLGVVLMSGYSSEFARQDQGLPSGMFFIQKPCGSAKLLRMLRHCLDEVISIS